jgi:hypothetical protein
MLYEGNSFLQLALDIILKLAILNLDNVRGFSYSIHGHSGVSFSAGMCGFFAGLSSLMIHGKREINFCSIRDTAADGLLSGNRTNDGKKRRENG